MVPLSATEHAEGFVARLASVRGNLPSPGTAKREYGDPELIAASPSRGAPFEEERCGDPVESDG